MAEEQTVALFDVKRFTFVFLKDYCSRTRRAIECELQNVAPSGTMLIGADRNEEDGLHRDENEFLEGNHSELYGARAGVTGEELRLYLILDAILPV